MAEVHRLRTRPSARVEEERLLLLHVVQDRIEIPTGEGYCYGIECFIDFILQGGA